MSPTVKDELRQMCRREPFQAFRVHVKSGRTFDVFDPLECLIGDIALVLPVQDPDDPTDGYPAFLDVGQVVRVELISASPTNGHAH